MTYIVLDAGLRRVCVRRRLGNAQRAARVVGGSVWTPSALRGFRAMRVMSAHAFGMARVLEARGAGIEASSPQMRAVLRAQALSNAQMYALFELQRAYLVGVPR